MPPILRRESNEELTIMHFEPTKPDSLSVKLFRRISQNLFDMLNISEAFPTLNLLGEEFGMRAAPTAAIVLDEKDNVATALRPLKSGKAVGLLGLKRAVSIIPIDSIPTGHKIALTNIRRRGYVIKYGEVIGRASAFIRKGSYVHVHNLRGRGGFNR